MILGVPCLEMHRFDLHIAFLCVWLGEMGLGGEFFNTLAFPNPF